MPEGVEEVADLGLDRGIGRVLERGGDLGAEGLAVAPPEPARGLLDGGFAQAEVAATSPYETVRDPPVSTPWSRSNSGPRPVVAYSEASRSKALPSKVRAQDRSKSRSAGSSAGSTR